MLAHLTASDPPIWYQQNRGLAVNATQEQWLPVVGYEGLYEVSSLGHVRSLDRVVPRGKFTMTLRGIALRQARATRGGYPVVNLSRAGTEISHPVHTLMLEAFVGIRPAADSQARHLNDIPTDNRLTNLAWGTRAENQRDMVRNGNHANANKTHCKWGHEYTPENTMRQNSGRKCRECKNQGERRRYQRKRANDGHQEGSRGSYSGAGG